MCCQGSQLSYVEMRSSVKMSSQDQVPGHRSSWNTRVMGQYTAKTCAPRSQFFFPALRFRTVANKKHHATARNRKYSTFVAIIQGVTWSYVKNTRSTRSRVVASHWSAASDNGST